MKLVSKRLTTRPVMRQENDNLTHKLILFLWLHREAGKYINDHSITMVRVFLPFLNLYFYLPQSTA